MIMSKKQSGFALSIAILIVVVLIVAGGAGYYFYKTPAEKAESPVAEEKIEEEKEVLEEMEAPSEEELPQEEIAPEEGIEEVPKIGEELEEELEAKEGVEELLPAAILEEHIPEVKDYPKFKQTVMDLYSSNGFSDTEIKFIKSIFNIFKLKTNLHQADEEILAYLVTDTIEPDMNLSKHYAMDMAYFVEELIPVANKITKDSSTEEDAVRKIVQWVRENIKENWTAVGIDDTPKVILEKKEVPTLCDYYATLITALCRASGIPAREVGGGLASPGHAWVEVYENGKWISVDSTGWLKAQPEKEKWLHSVYAYDPLNDRLMDISLAYNADILNLIIEHTKKSVGESATKQAEEIFTRYKKEDDLAKKYTYAQEIMEICISEIIAKEEEYESKNIKVLYLWDWDKLKKEENFLDELKKTKAISIYDITPGGKIRYRGTDIEEFPLEKINAVIPEIKQHFQGKIYFFFAHYLSMCGSLSDAITINLFSPEDVDILQMAYQDLFRGTPELLEDFVIEISDVANKAKDFTTFHLPQAFQSGTNYSIVTSAHFDMANTAWDIFFEIQSMVKIQDVLMVLSVDQTIMDLPDKYIKYRFFDNLKLIDKEGKIYADPKVYRNPRSDPEVVGCASYKDCPANIFIDTGQTIGIYRENNIIIIKGVLSTKQIIVD